MSARETKHKRYLLVLQLKAAGKSASEIARATGYTRRRVLQILAEARDEWANRRELQNVA